MNAMNDWHGLNAGIADMYRRHRYKLSKNSPATATQ